MNLFLQSISIMIFALSSIGATAQLKSMKHKMPTIKLISTVDIQEEINGEMARSSTVEVFFQPNAASMPHRHPGPVYGYILEGSYEMKMEGKPLQTLVAGDTFYEPMMTLHEIGRNPSDTSTTRVLAIIVHPRTTDKLMILE